MSEPLRINDLFHTFQGEGYFSGRPALFVRMPKCNLSCSWCDTEFDSHKEWTDKQFEDFATEAGPNRFAVLTGGEPLLNKQLPRVIKLLKRNNFFMAVETNGTMPMVDGINWVTCSPKRDAAWKIHRDLGRWINEFKYVVDQDFDFDVLKRHNIETKTSTRARLSLSPEFTDFEGNLKLIRYYIQQNPEWRISLQTHKWMGIE